MDDTKITDLNVGEYRKHLALVSQEPTLYDGTIRFNILLGATKPMEEVSQEEIERACADANILGFINSLPDGFETKVGGKGSQLSGGQKRKFNFRLACHRITRSCDADFLGSCLFQNESPSPVHCCGIPRCCFWTRPRRPWIPNRRRLCKLR